MENEKQKSAESEAENEGRLNVVSVEDVSLLTIEAESIEKNPNSKSGSQSSHSTD